MDSYKYGKSFPDDEPQTEAETWQPAVEEPVVEELVVKATKTPKAAKTAEEKQAAKEQKIADAVVSDWEFDIDGGAAVRDAAREKGLLATVMALDEGGQHVVIQAPSLTRKDAEALAAELGTVRSVRDIKQAS